MTIVFFDFDGTITTKDSFMEFLKFHKGKIVFYSSFIIVVLYYFLYLAKILSAAQAKEKILHYFIGGESKETLEDSACQFIAYLHGQKIIKPEFIKLIHDYKSMQAEITIVSASPDLWIKAFCDVYKINFISTGLMYKDEKFTGKFATPNCKGEEKVKRIKEKYDLLQYEKIIVYADSKDDTAMMQLATHKNWV